MKTNKLLSFLLVLCLACSLLFTACPDDKETSETSQAGKPVSEYQDAEGNYVGSTSGKKYEDEVVTILTCGSETVYESEILPNFENYENGARQIYPQIINEDLEKRASLLLDQYGIILDEMPYYSPTRKSGEFLQYVRKNSLTATEDYQIIAPCLYDGATLAVEGALYNLLDLEGLQIEAPWWNQEFNNSMTYANQLYFTIGDIGLQNKSCTAALFFNYELWNKYGFTDKFGGDPYDLVRNGDWTVDIVFEAAQILNNDLNNDGVVNYSDEFGWAGQYDDMWGIFFGSGERIANTDADGYPTITMFNERSAKVMEKLQEFVQGEGYYVSANDYFNVSSTPVDLTRGAFIDGRTLFFNDAITTVTMLGDMEQHFGVVPEPKFEKKQENYNSLVNPWGSNCFAIPVSVVGDKLTLTIDALNVLGAISKNTVAKDYQEVVLSYMKTRDEESAEMINNYILPTRACDIGMVYQWGGLDILLQEMAKKTPGSFASEFETRQDAAEAALEKTIDFYKDNR